MTSFSGKFGLKIRENSLLAAIVLAAGEGKRMKSTLSKVLHPIGNRPMLTRTLAIVKEAGVDQIIVVVSPKNSKVVKRAVGKDYIFAIQKKALGTANATESGLTAVRSQTKDVAVMYGDDTAFYRPETIKKVADLHRKSSAKITFVTLEKENPAGLGRIIRNHQGELIGIIEEKDASDSQKKIKEVNDGLYIFDKDWLVANLPKIKPSAATGEVYITDLIAIALEQGVKVQTYKLEDSQQWHGINTPEELLEAHKKLSIHIMGAAGAGASAVFQIAKAYGYKVTGCDLSPISSYTQNQYLDIALGHNKSHLENSDLLITSPAVEKLDQKNSELLEAKKLGIPIISWQKFQGDFLQKGKFVIAVAGAYGKSTTTAMIAQMLEDSGLDPTCEVGAKVLAWKTNFRVGKSKYYVCEADEYNNNFLNYQPDIAVVLNTSWDHPDFFKNKKAVVKSYKKFIDRIKSGGTLIISENTLRELSANGHLRGVGSFHLGGGGINGRPDIKIIKISILGDYRLSMIGDFRRENANAALSVATALGLDIKKAIRSIENFQGLGRRLEYKGEIENVSVYDDYAVQPYTVLKTADALKEKFKDKKVVLVFEPHTFSRVQTFFKEFVASLNKTSVDHILVTDVYPAREKGDRKGLSQKLAKALGPKATYSGSLDETAAYIRKNLGEFDIILTMGAGDIYKLYDLLQK